MNGNVAKIAAAVLVLGVLAACKESGNDRTVVVPGAQQPPPGSGDANLIAIHAQSGTLPQAACITCHGDMTDESSLDPDIVAPHVLHAQKINFLCTDCHVKTDLVAESGANVRRQVSAENICDQCHGPDGIAKQLYEQ